jgi:hypothetical protein
MKMQAKGQTHTQIARHFGISRSRVGQIKLLTGFGGGAWRDKEKPHVFNVHFTRTLFVPPPCDKLSGINGEKGEIVESRTGITYANGWIKTIYDILAESCIAIARVMHRLEMPSNYSND